MKLEKFSSGGRRRHSETGVDNNVRGGINEDFTRNNGEDYGFISNFLFRRGRTCRRFFRWLTKRKFAFCIAVLFVLVLSPYLLYHVLNSEMGRQSQTITSTNAFSSFIQPAPAESISDRLTTESDHDESADSFFSAFEPEKHVLDSMNKRLNELDRIRISLLNELRTLEEKRNNLRSEIETLTVQSERQQAELRKGYKDLEQVKLQVEQANLIRKEMAEKNTPEIDLPKPLRPQPFSAIKAEAATSKESAACGMATCFDHSRCSITAGFPIFVYGSDQKSDSNIFDSTLIVVFSRSVYAVGDPSLACVFIVLLKSGVALDQDIIKKYLPYWHRTGDGANHVVINADSSSILGRSLMISDYRLRFGFDILSPKFSADVPDYEDEGKLFLDSPPLIPARRRYFLYVMHCPSFINKTGENEGNFLISEFQRMGTTKTDDLFYFHPSCQSISSNIDQNADEKRVLASSTFSLLIYCDDDHQSNFLERFLLCLEFGAIPVVLTNSLLPFSHFLPFGENLDWRLASVQLPLGRLPELHFYLRTLTDSDIVSVRQRGQLFYRSYFSTKAKLAETILATLRQRLNIPPAPIDETGAVSFYNGTYQPVFGEMTTKTSELQGFNDDEYLGPIEMPYASPRYQQNFTLVSAYSYELWNVYAAAFRMYPQFPFTKPALPSEAKFSGSPYGFRPINDGAGGSGKEFSESLGGNYPREQFTVVLLTYEREQVLLASLGRLANLPYLNKIIVVWNGRTPPNPSTIWPKLSAPIVVINPGKNSLNNRFLPYREIETEAVLSIDDDVHLRRDEIIFGFRVWREARERVVGFPARFHAWDSSSRQWAYNSNHSCELSMVLTGAAFVHKYYFYIYTYSMPAAIRQKVDDIMNCEDIAMNFLVSHMTKKAPLKVTSRWTFRCPGCPETLSADESHFLERHDCLNYFTRVYGYNPLMYTQFRVDSILFKMRIPQTHQKCFKFI